MIARIADDGRIAYVTSHSLQCMDLLFSIYCNYRALGSMVRGFAIGNQAVLLPVMKPSLVVRDEDISMIEHTKYLRVHVNQYLNWDVHIAEVIKKISRALGMIRHAKQYLPLSILQTTYRSMVEPYFRFCCPVWGVCGTTPLNKPQKLQNRAARIVTDSPYRMSAPPIIRQLGWHGL